MNTVPIHTSYQGIPPRVFVTQIPHRRNNENQLVPSCNINPAAEHGDVIVMFEEQSNYFGTRETTEKLLSNFKDFNPDTDSLLPLGDPVLCGLAAALLGSRWHHFTILKWDKNIGRYTKNRVTL